MTRAVNLKREAYDVYIGRAGKGQSGYFGNPFALQAGEPRGATIAKYKAWFLEKVERDPEFRSKVLALKGKRLGCFCKPAACHGDVMAEWIEQNS